MMILAIIGKLLNLQRKLEERRKQLEEQLKRNKENIMRTIMTRKEAQEYLKNKKVYAGKHSREIQEKLFEIGYQWGLSGYREVKHTDKPFLFLDMTSTGRFLISYSNDVEHFNKSSSEEITAEEILAIEIKKEPYQFKPFDKILYREKEFEDAWFPGFYAFPSNIPKRGHAIIGSVLGSVFVSEVIPYEGNEDKLGKE